MVFIPEISRSHCDGAKNTLTDIKSTNNSILAVLQEVHGARKIDILMTGRLIYLACYDLVKTHSYINRIHHSNLDDRDGTADDGKSEKKSLSRLDRDLLRLEFKSTNLNK